ACGLVFMSARSCVCGSPRPQLHGDKMPAASTAKSFIAGTDQVPIHPDAAARPQAEPGYRVIRRNGAVTPFDATKITVALTKAFLAVEGSTAAGSRRVHDTVAGLTEQVVAA